MLVSNLCTRVYLEMWSNLDCQTAFFEASDISVKWLEVRNRDFMYGIEAELDSRGCMLSLGPFPQHNDSLPLTQPKIGSSVSLGNVGARFSSSYVVPGARRTMRRCAPVPIWGRVSFTATRDGAMYAGVFPRGPRYLLSRCEIRPSLSWYHLHMFGSSTAAVVTTLLVR